MGAVAVATQPLSALITEHVMQAERLHADDTPVPVLAKGKTRTGRLWTVVRDDRGIAVGRRNWTFAGSDVGGHRAAALYTLIETCKLNEVDPRAWLADVLARLPGHPAKRLAELLPWNWKALRDEQAAA
jgi:transposase